MGMLATACGSSPAHDDGGASSGVADESGHAATTNGADSDTTSSADTTLATSSSGGEVDGSDGSSGGEAPARLYGVTIDAIDPLPDIVDALATLHHRPTTRVVFDEFVPASDYSDAVVAIAEVSDVMGELVDSFYVAQYSEEEYAARAAEYLDTLGDAVAIWEVGNEINGEWVCAEDAESCTPEQTAAVVAKMQSAYELVVQRGGTTALTLYYNEDCWSSPDNEMFTWAEANIPPAMRDGLDYVLVSYYEDDCNDLQPDWPAVFAELAAMFPSAQLGIGECGTLDDTAKAEYVTRYYGMQIDEPRFVGGWFWWYFRQDMVPRTMPLWTVLDDALAP